MHLGKDAYIERGLEGRRRYFQLKSKNQENLLGFSFEELHYLATCRDIAAPLLPESVLDRINRTLTSVALHLGEQSASAQPFSFNGKGFIDYAPHLATIATLRKAIEKKQICHVVYRANGRETASSYRYAPGRILVMSGALYVQGYRLAEGSVLQERPTTFSLHRILEIAPTGEFFQFDAADTEARSFGLSWHKPKRVQVHIAPQAADYVRDRIWSNDQSIEDMEDGSIVLSVTTTSEKELQAWIYSFGGAAQVFNEKGRGDRGLR